MEIEVLMSSRSHLIQVVSQLVQHSFYAKQRLTGCRASAIGAVLKSTGRSYASKTAEGGGQSFWGTVDTLFEHRADTKSLIHRWDWHIWQSIAAMIPVAGVVCLAKFGEHHMQRKDAMLIAQEDAVTRQVAEVQAAREQEKAAQGGDNSTQQVNVRLLALEQSVQAMQKAVGNSNITDQRGEPPENQA